MSNRSNEAKYNTSFLEDYNTEKLPLAPITFFFLIRAWNFRQENWRQSNPGHKVISKFKLNFIYVCNSNTLQVVLNTFLISL
jgi:hypothetical protein